MRVLFVNQRSGNGDAAEEVAAAARERGIVVRDLETPEAEGAEAVGVAGGDGSLAPVAALALEHDLPLVVVPLGTRNNFARDLGLDPSDPPSALAAFDGAERRIDVGRVNGRVFLNNVSLGAYAAAVHENEEGRPLGRLARAALRLRRPPLRLEVDGRDRAVNLLLVGNNEYRASGRREQLDGGALSVYALERAGRLRLRSETRAGQRFVVRARSSRVRAAIDGEPVELEAPLEFELLPRALRVRLPA